MLYGAARFFISVLGGVAIGACANTNLGARERPRVVSVCEILQQPGKFDRQTVEIDGQVYPDEGEISGIRDLRCAPRFISVRRTPKPAVREEEIDKLFGDPRVRPDGEVWVKVIATVVSRPGEIPNVDISIHEYLEVKVKK